MGQKDIFLAAASLAAMLFLLLAGGAIVLFFFTAGSPLLLAGFLTGLGVMGLIALIGFLAALLGIWYIIYALMDNWIFAKKESKPESGNYALGRIKKA
ncbi:MAG: hypothetical protein V1861_04735 [Candidatus Micrarchaeota archaeon]